MERYIQQHKYIISRKLTQSLLCTPTYTTLRTRTEFALDCYRPLSADNVFPFKSLPSYLPLTVPNIR